MKGTIKQVGRYIVGEVVGEGSFGKVYKGVDRFDKSQVALKFISKRGKNKKQLQGLRSQNEMLKKICHKNIIKLLDFLETQNEMIIITEYAGQNLADVLQKRKKFSYQEVRAYCQQIFDALCYLDQNRIAHRDLKPQNILIQNEVIKICDFGFARKLSASTTFMNSLKGTPLYIAPQILGTGPLNYTKKVDVWSFGIIIFELLAGRPPFWAQNLQKLKPKILYEKVRFPKEMPIELRSLIDRMLQKNPEVRADWQELKKNSFFSSEPLRDISSNCSNMLNKSPPKQQIIKILDEPPIALKKQESQKQGNIPSQQVNGKLVRLANAQDIEDIKKIPEDLNDGKLDHKKLRIDNNFYQKIMTIYSSYFSGQNLVPKQTLNQITLILVELIKKGKPSEPESAYDILKRKQLLFCVLKLVDQDTEPQSVSNELALIGFLIKNNFDNISIDFQTDQDIIQICVRQIQACRTLSCFANAAILLGCIANQGIITLNNSEQFFAKINQDNVLSTISESFQPIPSKKVILQCIQKFIHTNQAPANISKTQHSLKKIFRSLKQQVANTLLNKNFLIYNPLTIYKDIVSVQTYAKILYECLNVSESFRKQFLKHNFWTDFLQHKNLRIFCFAYDYICIQKDKTCLIPNEVMKTIAISESNKKSLYMENAFFLARAEFYLSRKQIQTSNKQQSTLKLLNQICQLLSIDQQAKKKASRQVEGFLFSGQRIYEQVLGQTFCNILNDQMFDKSAITQNIIEVILEQTLNYKSDDELKVSLLTATRLITGIQQLVRTQSSKMRTNKKIITMLGDIIGFFLDNGFIYQIQSQNGPALTRKFLFSMFNIIKMHSIPSSTQIEQKSIIDKKTGTNAKRQKEPEKQLTRKQSQKQQKVPLQKQMQQKQSELYLKAELRGIHNLLISDAILDKYTLTLCLTLFLKLISQNKCTDAIIDFTGISLMDKFKNFFKLDLDDKDSEIIVQILHLTSLVIKKSEQYAPKIRQIDIISHFPRYLQHPNNQNVRQQTLTLIGNMAKHSQYFFDDFANNAIFPCVVDTYRRNGVGNKNKILKGIIYAVGNVSFYTDRFSAYFVQLVPCLYAGLQSPQLIPNTISTISNLLRHSSVYVKTLIQNDIFKRVLQIISQYQRQDNVLLLALNMIKKALIYPELFQAIPKSEFIAMYKEKVKIVGEDNQCMKKIKTFM